MQTVTIEAKFVDAPKPGKKNFSVKAADGNYYSVPPALGQMMRNGGTYEIQYEDATFNNKTFRMVKNVADKTPAPSANGSAHNSTGYNSTAKDEHIFVCGAINNAIRAGQLNITTTTDSEGVLIMRKLQTWWRMSVGNPQNNADMNDEIPY